VTGTLSGELLSRAQALLLEHAGAGAALRVLAVAAIEGGLDPARLRAAALALVEAHEILRTRFVEAPGVREPLQVIDPVARVEWSQADRLSGDDALAAWHRAAGDLARDPVLRLRLEREGGGARLLVSLPPGMDGAVISLRELAARLAGAASAVEGVDILSTADATRSADIEGLVAPLCQALGRLPPRPTVLVGYSYGGVLAHELARRLVASGGEVRLLAVIDSHVPGGLTWRPLPERLRIHAGILLFGDGQRRRRWLARAAANLRRRLERPAPAVAAWRSNVLAPLLSARRRAMARFRPRRYPGTLTLLLSDLRRRRARHRAPRGHGARAARRPRETARVARPGAGRRPPRRLRRDRLPTAGAHARQAGVERGAALARRAGGAGARVPRPLPRRAARPARLTRSPARAERPRP
jgi:thioesterase domain-containing protein